MKIVTRKEMIADLHESLKIQLRIEEQRALLDRLEAGGLPTNHETSKFYGAGWRCRESLVFFVGERLQRVRLADGSERWGYPCFSVEGVLLGYCDDMDLKRFWMSVY